ncbi:ABC transporter substrate-binding protein, partial [uncultured Massilia sp.]|uniref:substrate-binding periplasmic protein n=1 Tax=uncultured Massilia sp. TaxID=169973 RepID=UPI0027D98505
SMLAGLASTIPAAAAVAVEPARLYITTELLAPSSMMEGGRVVGIATDKVREAMRRSGVDYRIEVLPWKRAYHAALTRGDACVYSTTRTPEREALFKWVGPTDIAQWVMLGRADRKLRLRSLADARGLRIGTYNGDAREAWLRSRGFTLDSTSNDLSNLNKLMAGRIDLWAASMRSDSNVLARFGYEKQVVPLLVFNEIGVYLACNRAVPDELVGRLNGAFADMARDGTGRRIERSYEGWEPAPGPAGPRGRPEF